MSIIGLLTPEAGTVELAAARAEVDLSCSRFVRKQPCMCGKRLVARSVGSISSGLIGTMPADFLFFWQSLRKMTKLPPRSGPRKHLKERLMRISPLLPAPDPGRLPRGAQGVAATDLVNGECSMAAEKTTFCSARRLFRAVTVTCSRTLFQSAHGSQTTRRRFPSDMPRPYRPFGTAFILSP
jgi:hypothetical protein